LPPERRKPTRFFTRQTLTRIPKHSRHLHSEAVDQTLIIAGEEAETYKFTLARIRPQPIDTPDSR